MPESDQPKLRLPTNLLFPTLLGVCRPLPEGLERFQGSAYRWTGLLGGTTGELFVPWSAEGQEAFRRAGQPLGMVEMAAILTRAVELDGKPGQWNLEQVAKLLWGPRDRGSSHRSRYLKALKGWLLLMEHGHWAAEAEVRGGSAGPLWANPKARYGASFDFMPLLSVKENTIQLAPLLTERLATPAVEVPPSLFRVSRSANPSGHLPPAAALARIRIVAALQGRLGSQLLAKGRRKSITLKELVKLAGVPTAPIDRDRRWSAWLAAVVADLQAQGQPVQVLPAAEAEATRLQLGTFKVVEPAEQR